MSLQRRSAGLALAAALTLLVPTSASASQAATQAAQATQAQIAYVALGDSYSAGTGTRRYLADGTSCQRSALSYPSLVAAARGLSLSLRACSGATVADVTNSQLAALTPTTRQVTISVGGNDAGFVGVLTECAKPAWMSDCLGRVDDADAFIRGDLPDRLTTLYGQIKARAPQATVTVVGYPRVFNGIDCSIVTWFSPQEQQRLNNTADLLNATISTRATAAGFTFANPTTRFAGHAVCDSPEWVNGLSNPISESYHPNRAGHASGYLPLVSASVGGASGTGMSTRSTGELTSSPQTRARAEASSAALTADARRHAAQDRAIEPEVVQPVDLHSPQARAAAAAAGVDVDDPASVDRADARASQEQALAHGLTS